MAPAQEKNCNGRRRPKVVGRARRLESHGWTFLRLFLGFGEVRRPFCPRTRALVDVIADTARKVARSSAEIACTPSGSWPSFRRCLRDAGLDEFENRFFV